MKKNFLNSNIFLLSFFLEGMLILFVSLANLSGEILYAVFYNLIYGLLISVMFPLYYIHKRNENISSLGIKKIHFRQLIVILFFVIFSVGGQLIPPLLSGEKIEIHLLGICVIPLLMTTFFEEFLFRGFLQTRLEQQYGWITAVLFSGFLFSLYHIGYPGFRNLPDLLLLFAVGTGFALAYKLSDNNLTAVYFINLPNAIVTYLLKSEQFPPFTKTTSFFALLTLIVITLLLCFHCFPEKHHF